jgi:N-acyl-D-amino-acid deacylase
VILLPNWARGGSPEEIVARLSDPAERARIEDEVAGLNHDYSLIQIGIARSRRDAQGLTLQQLGDSLGVSPITAAIDLLVGETGFVGAAHFALAEEDVERILRDPHTMIGSDGVATTPDAPEQPHPRSYGTFPRVLGRYVRERGVIGLADAIHRMTGLPATRMRLADRGILSVGNKADVTVFRPDKVGDLATCDRPHQYPSGIAYVFVNGQLSVEGGVQTDARAGQVLRRP